MKTRKDVIVKLVLFILLLSILSATISAQSAYITDNKSGCLNNTPGLDRFLCTLEASQKDTRASQPAPGTDLLESKLRGKQQLIPETPQLIETKVSHSNQFISALLPKNSSQNDSRYGELQPDFGFGSPPPGFKMPKHAVFRLKKPAKKGGQPLDTIGYELPDGMVEMNFTNQPIKRIRLVGADTKKEIEIGVDDIQKSKLNKNQIKGFALDPTKTTFTTGSITLRATGKHLFKCPTWNFQNETCPNNEWIFVRHITPGQDVEIEISPEDPGFGEGNTSIVVLKKNNVVMDYNETVTASSSSKKNLTIKIAKSNATKIHVEKFVNNQTNDIIKVDENTSVDKTNDSRLLKDVAFDTKSLNASKITIEVIASGKNAFICNQYNFTLQNCTTNNWTLAKDITPNTKYNLTVGVKDNVAIAENKNKVVMLDKNLKLRKVGEQVISTSGSLSDINYQIQDDIKIKNLKIYRQNTTDNKNKVKMQDKLNKSLLGFTFSEAFSIDPTSNKFDFAEVTANATGKHLFKCVNFNFTTQKCTDDVWKIVKALSPGKTYKFNISGDDPGFSELNSTVSITDPDGILFHYNESVTWNNSKNISNLHYKIAKSVVKTVNLTGHNKTQKKNDLRISNETNDAKAKEFVSISTINTSIKNVTLTLTPTERNIFSCTSVDLATGNCTNGNWTLMKDTTPSQTTKVTIAENKKEALMTPKQKVVLLDQNLRLMKVGETILNTSGGKSDIKYSLQEDLKVKSLKIMRHNTTDADNKIKLDKDLTGSQFGFDFKSVYALDPTANDFTYAEVEVNATGKHLFKCVNYNFTTEICAKNNWTKVKDIIPGKLYKFNLTALDPAYSEINATIELLDDRGELIRYNESVLANHAGNLSDFKLTLINNTIKEIIIKGYNKTRGANDLKFTNRTQEAGDWAKAYSIDPTGMSFKNATIIISNTSMENKVMSLYKCLTWNATTQTCTPTCAVDNGEVGCFENWTQIKSITPGTSYNFTIMGTDPGFAESSLSMDVSISPLDEQTMVLGYLSGRIRARAVTAENATFKIIHTNGSVVLTKTVDTSIDTKSRVAVSVLNESLFVFAYIDGPSTALKLGIYNRTGQNVTQLTTIDSSIGTYSDVSLAIINNRIALCNANDFDDDADFRMYNFSLKLEVAESYVDGKMSPSLGNNLIECSGVNRTYMAYMWFDSPSRNIKLVSVHRNGTVGSTITQDAASGTRGAVDIAGLNNNRFAAFFYDGPEQDVTLGILNINGSAILANTDIDTTVGGSSYVAVTAVRVNETSTDDRVAMAWKNNSNSKIYAAVYNTNGSAVVRPFVVASIPSTANIYLDIAGRRQDTDAEICPGTFIVAYVNVSNVSEFRGYIARNGSSWNGNCRYTRPPSVVNDKTLRSQYLYNETVQLRVNTSSRLRFPTSKAWVNVTLPNGSMQKFTLSSLAASRYEVNLSELTLRGVYNLTFYVNDTKNRINQTVKKSFHRKGAKIVDFLNDSSGLMNYNITITANKSGLLNMTVKFANSKIKSINITKHNEKSSKSIFKISDASLSGGINEPYVFDPTGFNLTFARITINSSQTGQLYKCKNYSFSLKDCLDDNWTAVLRVTRGQTYTINVTDTDPGFLETGNAAAVSMAPFNTSMFVIAYVDRSQSDISFKIMHTNGNILRTTVDADTSADNDSRVSVAVLNRTHFALSWIDGPSDAARFAIYRLNNTAVTAAVSVTDIDTTVTLNNDIWTASMGNRFVVCYVDDSSNDAQFLIRNVTGVSIVGITDIDTDISPETTLNNLFGCAGLNRTGFGAIYFDDVDNDATLNIRNLAGTNLTSSDLDTDVGETGQVAITSINPVRYAMAWYDSTDDDITIAVRNRTNHVILSPTDIDTSAGTSSRVAIAAMRRNTSAQDYFVVAWYDGGSTNIKAQIFNSTGRNVSGPHIVESSPDTTWQLQHVMGRDTVTAQSICTGKFVVAYSNSTTVSVFKGFNFDGTQWQGNCNDNYKPNVSSVSPLSQSKFNTNQTIPIIVVAKDDIGISVVWANISRPGKLFRLKLTLDPIAQIYKANFTNTTVKARYNVTVMVNDTSNNKNESVKAFFYVQEPIVNITKSASPNASLGRNISYTTNISVIKQPGIVPLIFTSRKFITNNTIREDSPQMIVSTSESILIAYTEFTSTTNANIKVKRSVDNGVTFSNPITVAGTSLNETFPNIAQLGSMIYVTYNREQGGQRDLFFANSTNDGVNWTSGFRITNTTYSESETSIEKEGSQFVLIYEAIISPDTDVELYVQNSTNLITWSTPRAMTSNTYADYDPDLLVTNGKSYLTWAPATPDFQEIYFANRTTFYNIPAGGLELIKTQVTDNDVYDYEPSLQIDLDNITYISWVQLQNTTESANPDTTRTSNEIFVAQSSNLISWSLNQITDDAVSDTYPGLVQQGINTFFFITYLRRNGTDMDLVFSQRDCSAGDATIVVVEDPQPQNSTVLNSTINSGGAFYPSGKYVKWSVGTLYERFSRAFRFNVSVHPRHTKLVMTNVVYVNYTNCVGRFIERANRTATTVVLNNAPRVTLNASLVGKTYLLNDTAKMRVNVSDIHPISKVYANITLPNGSQIRVVAVLNGIEYTINLTNLRLRGTYNISWFANDTHGKLNLTTKTYFRRVPLHIIDVINQSDKFHNYTVAMIANKSGVLNLSVVINGKHVKRINISFHTEKSPRSIITLDDHYPFSETPKHSFNEFGIDFREINLTRANIFVNATGNHSLYKCVNYTLVGQICNDGEWAFVRRIVGGKIFNFTMGPTDPGFLETSAAIDTAVTPFDNTTFVVAFVENRTFNISFKVMHTNGTTIVSKKVVDTTGDETSRVDVVAMNRTHFAISWVDGPSNDITRAIYLRNGTNVFAAADVDTNVGMVSDVSIAEMSTRFPVCYANDNDGDADYQIFRNNGSSLIGELNVDGNMNPFSTNNNLVSCAVINDTRWVYAWYDRQGQDISYAILNHTGVITTSEVDADSDAGIGAQVASTSIDRNKFVIVWYDATDNDISYTVRSAAGATIVAATDIDTDAGSISRVAVSAIRNISNAARDMFVVAWTDGASTDIKATIINSTGTTILAPFVVDSMPETTFRIIDVVARDSSTTNSLCPGTFAVAYSNASRLGVFKTFLVNGSTWDGRCGGQANLKPTNLTFSTNSPRENQNITLNATIKNIGSNGASSILVQFRKGSCSGAQINGNKTITSLASGATTFVQVAWSAFPVGPTNIFVCVNPQNSTPESNFTDNRFNKTIHVQAYNTYYGSLKSNLTLRDTSADQKYAWVNPLKGVIYFYDNDSHINFNRLQALGRNRTGHKTTNDFSDADTNLAMTGFNDSIVRIFAINASTPKKTFNITLFGTTVLNVPYINSTNTTKFWTAILWDTTKDTNGQYDTTNKEDLVFIGNINKSLQGKFGIYDYEVRIPVLLRTYNASTSRIGIEVETR